MPSDLENLQTRRSAILAELAAGETPGGDSLRKPSYSIDGQSVDWSDYRRSLYDELREIDRLIATTGGPVEVQSEATT